MWSVCESVLYSSVVCVHRSGQQTKGRDVNSATIRSLAKGLRVWGLEWGTEGPLIIHKS